MRLIIRKASPVDDKGEMLELLKRNLPDPPELGFDWRYIQNPAGVAWSWFLDEEGSKRAVAMASLFPRTMYIDGKPILAGQVMHFVVDVAHRSLGPAVMLQRATFDPVNSGEIGFCYDCPPHDQGMSTFVRLGMRPNCEVTRYALLLRSDEYFKKKMASGPWTKPVIAAANLVLHMRSMRPAAAGLEILESNTPFDEEFSNLDKLVSTRGVVTRRRSAEDLNWRYRENPEHRYRVFLARRAGELLGFAVFIESDGFGGLLELFGRELDEVGASLLSAGIEMCRKQNLSAVHAYCSDQSELKPLFEKIGFRPRERVARVVAYAKSGGPVNQLLGNSLRWSFSHAELSG